MLLDEMTEILRGCKREKKMDEVREKRKGVWLEI